MSLVKKNGSRTGLLDTSLFSDFFDVEKFFDTSLPSFVRRTIDFATPAVNIKEGDVEFDIDVVAPGFKKDDFKISINEDALTISSKREEEKKEEDKQYTRREYNFHSFSRSFALPENADAEKISAKYEDGVLHIIIPKTEISQNTAREINIG